MNNVVEIKVFRSRRAAARAAPAWKARFAEPLTEATRLQDLSDTTLLILARSGEETATLLYDIIMAALGLGAGVKFQYMRGEPKIRVLDTHLFLVDQIRWECMRRLGWVQGFAAESYPIMELILDNRRVKAAFRPMFPDLLDAHPEHGRFLLHRNVEGEAILRGLIPSALAAFGERIKKKPQA